MADTLLCRLLGHRVRRNHVRKDGDELIGRCRWCRVRMTRANDGWQVREPRH